MFTGLGSYTSRKKAESFNTRFFYTCKICPRSHGRRSRRHNNAFGEAKRGFDHVAAPYEFFRSEWIERIYLITTKTTERREQR